MSDNRLQHTLTLLEGALERERVAGYRIDTFRETSDVTAVWQTTRFQRPHRMPHPTNERGLVFNMGMMVPTVFAISMR